MKALRAGCRNEAAQNVVIGQRVVKKKRGSGVTLKGDSEIKVFSLHGFNLAKRRSRAARIKLIEPIKKRSSCA